MRRQLLLLPPLFLLAFSLVLVYGCGGNTTVRTTRPGGEPSDDNFKELSRKSRQALQDIFQKETDLKVCREALQEFNNTLAQLARRKEAELKDLQGEARQQKAAEMPLPAPLDDEARQLLTKADNGPRLDPGELTEVENGSFTLLDGYHLDHCFLMRDAARSLEADGLPAVDKARLAFGWAVRQVRLGDKRPVPLKDGWLEEPFVPPPYALRRGWGDALERACVFLAVLEQLGGDGCLVTFPAVEGQATHFTCGVLGDGERADDVYLFDPHLGLPLPGPDGKGVATLADVQKQPHLLAAFPAGDAFRFRVKPTKLQLVCPVSALAPRMRYLEKEMLEPAVRVRLAQDPRALLDRFQKAAARLGSDGPKVEFLPAAAGMLRRFLPAEEGGAAKGLADELSPLRPYRVNLIPLEELPPVLFKLRWSEELGGGPWAYFVGLFAPFSGDPGTPRDRLLRGRYAEAASDLVRLREQLPNRRAFWQNRPELQQELERWADNADKAHLAVLRARGAGGRGAADLEKATADLNQVIKAGEKLWPAALEAATAYLRLAQATYLLALCKHEQAERLEEKRGRAGGDEAAALEKEARDAWATAASWWDTFANEYPSEATRKFSQHPSAPNAAFARLLQARARERLGSPDAAARLLEDTSGAGRVTPLELAARQYLARQLK